MTIEEKVFFRRRFVREQMASFGFRETDGGLLYGSDIMDGDFYAELFVSDGGRVSGKVVDRMNDEEYAPLRAEDRVGAYVGSVRESYEAWLEQIASECCTVVLFASEQANRIAGMIFDKYGVSPDYPWGEDRYKTYGTFRHKENRKWFALLMNIKRSSLFKNDDGSRVDALNLKIDPDKGPQLVQRAGIYPAYHMNHKNWITAVLDDTLTDGDVMSLVDESYELTRKK
jgi:predicted DNA-binding protein (MmcQ/YjbR family)